MKSAGVPVPYDGLSIAWAVVEHLHGKEAKGPKTLFATHYHELTKLADSLPRLKNYSVAVKEWNDEIIFVTSGNTGSIGAILWNTGCKAGRFARWGGDRAKQIPASLEETDAGNSSNFRK